MFYIALMMLFVFSIMGMFLSISSNKWFVVWLGFEVNLFCLLPLIKENKNKGVELYYFIIQVMGTVFLLWGCLLHYNSFFGVFGLFMKMGFFPFFWWVPSLFLHLDWMVMFIISVLQKIPSLFLFRWFDLNNDQILIMGMLVLSISILGLFKSINSLKLLFGWSSVINTSLVLILSVYSSSFISMLFFFLYGLMSFYCCFSFSKSNLKNFGSFLKKSKCFWLFNGIISLFFFTGIPQLGFIYKLVFFSGFVNLDLEWMILFWFILNLFFQIMVYLTVFKKFLLSLSFNKVFQIKYSFIVIFLYFGLFPMFFFVKS